MGKKIEPLNMTYLSQEGKSEGNLETWIENDPSLLGDNLLIIGRQVQVPDVKDRIDLLPPRYKWEHGHHRIKSARANVCIEINVAGAE